MEKISQRLDQIAKDPLVTPLFVLTRCYNRDETKNRYKSMKIEHEWFVHNIDSAEPLQNILSRVVGSKTDATACLELIMPVLRQTLYSTNVFIGSINEKNAPELATIHPISIWLYDHYEKLMIFSTIAMCLNGYIGNSAVISLIRLYVGLQIFKVVLMPAIIEANDAIIKQCDVEFLKLGSLQDC